MSPLEAEGHAAAIVRQLRDEVAKLRAPLDRIRALERGLKALQPDLDPLAAERIDRALEILADEVHGAFVQALNPAEDPA